MERNPYRYGAPVGGTWFCDRVDERAGLGTIMRDGIHAFVLSPRRYGKTSLLQRALDDFRRRGGRAGYVNLLFCATELEVASAVLDGVVRGVLQKRTRARHSVEHLVERLRIRPRVTFGTDGRVELSFDPSLGAESWTTVLADALNLLAIGDGRPAALVLDEFQTVATIGRRGLGGAFKAAADQTAGTSIIFSGSHLSVMEKLTRGKGAPLEGMGERFVLDVIPESAMVPYLQRRAKVGGKTMPKATAVAVYERATGIPNYVQWLAHGAFEAAGPAPIVAVDHVEDGLAFATHRQASDLADRYETLAPSQQRTLRHLAGQPTARPFTKAFLDAVQVANANSVTAALRVLQERELVDRRAGSWQVTSPFVRQWLLGR